MRHAAGKADKLALMEHRKREGQVVEMAAGDVRIVGQQNVAGGDALRPEKLDLGLHGFRHAADEHRQAEPDRHRLAVFGENTDGEVQRLIDDHIIGGAHQIGLHLLGHRHHAVADDFDENRIDFDRAIAHQRGPEIVMTRLPMASTSALSAGRTTVVEACSSISAGPIMRLPASNAERAKVGVSTNPPAASK